MTVAMAMGQVVEVLGSGGGGEVRKCGEESFPADAEVPRIIYIVSYLLTSNYILVSIVNSIQNE